MKKGVAAIALLMMVTIGALAQDRTPRVDQRQAQQRVRIRQGFVQGDLTRRETARLVAAQQMIRRAECLAKVDGQVTLSERIRLRHMQQQSNRQIFRERHDRQSRVY